MNKIQTKLNRLYFRKTFFFIKNSIIYFKIGLSKH